LYGRATRTSRTSRGRLPGAKHVGPVLRRVPSTECIERASPWSNVASDGKGRQMRGRSILATVVVTGAAVAGGSAALESGGVSSSASDLPMVTTTGPSAVTSQINSLVTEAQRLGTQITIARRALSRLEQQILPDAANRRSARASAVSAIPTSAAATTPATHATTGASSLSANNNSDSNGDNNDN